MGLMFGILGTDKGILKNKISYWGCSAHKFVIEPTQTNLTYRDGSVKSETNGGSNKTMWASVELPHGAVVLNAKVFGSGGTWELRTGVPGSFPTTLMAAANHNVPSGSIINSPVDNEKRVYWFKTIINTEQFLYGATITYLT